MLVMVKEQWLRLFCLLVMWLLACDCVLCVGSVWSAVAVICEMQLVKDTKK